MPRDVVGLRVSGFTPPVDAPPGSPFHSPGRPGHEGVDYPLPVGSVVRAIGDGVVVRAAPNATFGNVVVLDHGVIGGRHTYSLYAHLDAMRVAAGDRVARGGTLGLSGDTGRSRGPHLHFEVIESAAPLRWSPKAGPMGVAGATGRVDPLSRLAPAEPQGPPVSLAGDWHVHDTLGPPALVAEQDGTRLRIQTRAPRECMCYDWGATPGVVLPPQHDYFEGVVSGDAVQGWVWECRWTTGRLDDDFRWVKCKAQWVKVPLTLRVKDGGRSLHGKQGDFSLDLYRPDDFEIFTPPAGGSIR